MCWCLHVRRRTGPVLDRKTFYLESADRMAQCTLQTDLNPGVGPSGDQLYPYEVRAFCHASEASCLASVCAQTLAELTRDALQHLPTTPGPRGPSLAVRRAQEEAGEASDGPDGPTHGGTVYPTSRVKPLVSG